jgi:hypothetical protein
MKGARGRKEPVVGGPGGQLAEMAERRAFCERNRTRSLSRRVPTAMGAGSGELYIPFSHFERARIALTHLVPPR